MIPPEAFGVRCMSMGFFVDDDQPVIWRGPMLHKALEQFLVDVDWGDPEFLLVDMPPGTGDVALSMAQYLPTSEVYVVTTPQPAARRVAQRSAYMAKTAAGRPFSAQAAGPSWLTSWVCRSWGRFRSTRRYGPEATRDDRSARPIRIPKRRRSLPPSPERWWPAVRPGFFAQS